MKNIQYSNGKYYFSGLKVVKDSVGYDLELYDQAIQADKMFIYPLSLAIQNKDDVLANGFPFYTAEELVDMFVGRDRPAEDYQEFINAYGFEKIYTERKPYITMSGPFSNAKSLWKIVYPTSISSFGLIEPKAYQRDGLSLKTPDRTETLGTLDYNTFQLYKTIENANTVWSSSTQIQKYKLLEEIQNQAREANVNLDKALADIKIISPNRIVPDVQKLDEDKFKLVAEIDVNDVPQENFIKHFENRNLADNIYTVEDEDGKEVKVLFDEEQRQILSDIKQQKNATTEELKEFIQSPPENWNDEIVDTSKLYGDRVLGWHLYTPEFKMPELGPNANGWYDQANEEEDLGNIELVSKPTEDKTQIMIDIKDNEEFLDYEKLNNQKIKEYEVPAIPGGYRSGITAKSYQNEGIAWLYTLHKNKDAGCILADDMGLGKTFQVLSFLQAISGMSKLALVVTPASLVENWENEYYKFFSDYKYRIVKKGSARFLLDSIIQDQSHNREIRDNYIFITNYESLRSEKDYLKVKWDVTVLDEAQRIKNPLTLTNKTARGLQTEFRVAITGTPVENTFSDIWAISDFACPGKLGTHQEFKKKYTLTEYDTDNTMAQKGLEIRKSLGESLLRRTKADTLDNLPEKELVKIDEFMPNLQASAYRQVLALSATHTKLSEKLMILQMLRKTSDHQALLGENFEPDVYSFEDTARTIILKKLLHSIKQRNEKVLIFAEYIRTQEILASIIYDEFGIKPSIYNGSVPIHVREQILKRFKSVNGFNIIIMSPIAAGVGLTITEANNVIHYSRHWNPAKEDQATDRVYRIGQTKKVYVYNLIGRVDGLTSFDEKLDILLSRKQNIKGAALFPSASLEIKTEEFVEDLMS